MNRYEMFAAMLQRKVVTIYGVTLRDDATLESMDEHTYRAKCERAVGIIAGILPYNVGMNEDAGMHQFHIFLVSAGRKRSFMVRSEVEGVA